tara:strand:- start:253 stop:450 length:198 start_codon:yes stop_codon:yes gene_type:complete
MNRFDHLHKQYREAKMKERKERLLQSSRPTIDTNGGGTSGYRFKQGPNTGAVAGHISVDHQNRSI